MSLIGDFKNIKGLRAHAGVIPQVWDGFQWLYGLGKDVKTGNLSDFGGGVESKDLNIIDGAFREFDEESMGVFGDWRSLAIDGELDDLPVIYGKIRNRDWLLISLPILYQGMPYPIEYRTEFSRRRSRELRRPQTHYNPRLEMSDIVWLTKNELLTSPRVWPDLRHFLHEV